MEVHRDTCRLPWPLYTEPPLEHGAHNTKIVDSIPMWAIHRKVDLVILVGPSQVGIFCESATDIEICSASKV